jgi:hypothetical protein
MVLGERSIVYGTFSAFLVNFIYHAYMTIIYLTKVPQDILGASFCIPFFFVWIVVWFGLLRRRKWGFQLGIVISLLGVVVSFGGFFLLGYVEALPASVVDIIQIGFCTYGLRKLKF